MQATRRQALRRVHLGLDAIAIAAAMLAAYLAHRALFPRVDFLMPLPPIRSWAALPVTTMPMWLALIAVFGLNRSFERTSSRLELFVELCKLHGAGLIAIALFLFITQIVINRSLVGFFLVGSFVGMFALRSALGAWIRTQHRLGHARDRILLVGQPTGAMAAFARDAAAESLAPELVGYVGPAPAPAAAAADVPPGVAHLGELGDLTAVIQAHPADHVLFFPPHHHPERVPEALAVCEELGVHAAFAVDLVKLSASVPQVGFLYDRPFIEFDVAPKRPAALAIKHGVDTLGAAIAVIVLSPLLVTIAVLVAVSMGRPVLFAQERAGRYGRRFRMLKFRTMVRDAEELRPALEARNEMTGPVFKLTDDPRVTRLGAFLRRSSLDELPQLFNVLSGSMSLVGPRPLARAEQERIAGWRRRRLSMKPGITGLWQVSGRNDVDFEEWMALDLRYIDDWSLGLDLKILLMTLPAVVRGRGAR